GNGILRQSFADALAPAGGAGEGAAGGADFHRAEGRGAPVAAAVAEGLGVAHEFDPYREREFAAVAFAVDAAGLIEADPNTAGDAGIETHEPCVVVVIGGAGLSSHGLNETGPGDFLGGAAGSADFLQ